MAKAIHSMVRVIDEARSVNFYKNAFGLGVADRFDFNDFTVIFLRNPEIDFELELTVNKERKEPYSLGDGYGHLAVSVDDIESEHRRFSAAGLNPRDIVEFNRDGALMAKFFFVEDPDGYKIEVLQKHGRFH